jgi:hypothetical protein
MIAAKPRTLLLFLALLLAWGESLASPFMACLHDAQQSPQQTMQLQYHYHDHAVIEAPLVAAPMTEHVGHGDHHTHMAHGSMAPVVMDHAAATALHATADCDGHCVFCRGMGMPDIVSPLGTGMPLLLSWARPVPLLSAAVPPPADHFRPPALV